MYNDNKKHRGGNLRATDHSWVVKAIIMIKASYMFLIFTTQLYCTQYLFNFPSCPFLWVVKYLSKFSVLDIL